MVVHQCDIVHVLFDCQNRKISLHNIYTHTAFDHYAFACDVLIQMLLQKLCHSA